MYVSAVSSRWYDLNDVLRRERKNGDHVRWTQFRFPFDQIVFSGGGMRGYSFCGGLKVSTRAIDPSGCFTLGAVCAACVGNW